MIKDSEYDNMIMKLITNVRKIYSAWLNQNYFSYF